MEASVGFLQCVKLQSLSKQKMPFFTIISFRVSHSNGFSAIMHILVLSKCIWESRGKATISAGKLLHKEAWIPLKAVHLRSSWSWHSPGILNSVPETPFKISCRWSSSVCLKFMTMYTGFWGSEVQASKVTPPLMPEVKQLGKKLERSPGSKVFWIPLVYDN